MARGCTTGPCGPGRSRARSWYGARNDALDPTGGHGGVRRRSRVLGVAARHLASTVAAAILDVHRCVRRGWWPASADVVCGREVPRLGAARSDLGAVGGRHAAAGGPALLAAPGRESAGAGPWGVANLRRAGSAPGRLDDLDAAGPHPLRHPLLHAGRQTGADRTGARA